MSISLVLTVYNGEKSLSGCLDSILDIDFPNKQFELIIVDDASFDDTKNILEQYKVHFKKKGINLTLIYFNSNEGRIKARIMGATKAVYSKIMIVDVQMRISKDALIRIVDYGKKSHLITNLTMDKYRNIDSTVLYLLRKKYYSPYWGYNFSNILITKDNFENIPKGTGGFVTDKNTFLRLSKKLQGKKIENEDTKLFRMYLEYGAKLIRVFDVKSEYVNRSGAESIQHLFSRGPRFVDYYFKNKLPFKLLYVLSILMITASLYICFLNPNLTVQILVFALLINLMISIYLSENIRDVLAVFIYLPIIIITFYMGTTYGVYLHIIRKV